MPQRILTKALDPATINWTLQKVPKTRGGLKANQIPPKLCRRHSQVCHKPLLHVKFLLIIAAAVALEDSNLEDIRIGQYRDREGNVISASDRSTFFDGETDFLQLILTGQTLLDRGWNDRLTLFDRSMLQPKVQPAGGLHISDHVSTC